MRRMLLGVILTLCVAMQSAWAQVVTDDLGRNVRIPDQPQRIAVANIFPMVSFLVAYGQAPERIVAMHPASYSAAQYGLLGALFPALKSINTRTMQGANVQVERLLALDPDVVLINASDRRTVEQLEAMGICVLAVSATQKNYTIEPTRQRWFDFAQALFPDSPISREKIQQADQKLNTLIDQRLASLTEKKPSLLFFVRLSPTEMITSGRQFFGEDWAKNVRAENAASYITVPNAQAQITMEDVHGMDPDVILLTNFTTVQPIDLLENRLAGSDWSQVRAIQNKKVYKMPLGLYRTFTPSPESPLIRFWLAQTLYPKAFADLSRDDIARSYYQDAFGLSVSDQALATLWNPSRNAGHQAARAR